MTFVKLGDYVVVTDESKQYTTYEDWANSNRLKNWKRGNSCLNGFCGVVTAISPHGNDKKKLLIAVCGDGYEIIIGIKGVERVQKTSGMKPIKKGMTEAVTRDGRKVTQLTWFEVNDGAKIYGVVGGLVHAWHENGNFWNHTESDDDIFAHVEYEWQWLIKNDNGSFSVSAYRQFDLSIAGNRCCNIDADDYKGDARDNAIWYSRIEESKREVK